MRSGFFVLSSWRIILAKKPTSGRIISRMIKRRNYFISPSIQIKYILMSVLPASIIGIYATIFLFKTSELLLFREERKLSVEISGYICNVSTDIKDVPSIEARRNTVKFLENLYSLQNYSQKRYLSNIKFLNEFKNVLLFGEALIFVCVGILALVYSHRIAGPMFRISKYLEMMIEGKEIPPVKVRYYDEFKEVAELLDKLRAILKEKK